MKYRHEWKHEIHFGDMLILRQRLAAIAKRDSYASGAACHNPIFKNAGLANGEVPADGSAALGSTCKKHGQTYMQAPADGSAALGSTCKKHGQTYMQAPADGSAVLGSICKSPRQANMEALADFTTYEVRSLYFDNIADKALREKIDGVNIREKFRIRCYNRDTSFIRLEKKSKVNGLCLKENAILTKGQVHSLLHGDYGWMAASGIPLIAELYSKMMGQGLRPKTIVDYTREPFVFSPGNVRITLDYNIRTGMQSTDFLNPRCVTVPARNCPIILEVKWDDFLPDIIRDAVQLKACRVGAFSKYAACRAYG